MSPSCSVTIAMVVAALVALGGCSRGTDESAPSAVSAEDAQTAAENAGEAAAKAQRAARDVDSRVDSLEGRVDVLERQLREVKASR